MGRTIMSERSAKWKAQCKAWWAKNWELKRWYAMKKNYGPTAPEHYKKRLRLQKSKCDICGKKMNKPNLDHNHETGKLRSLLCAGCNAKVAAFESKLAGKVKSYLRKWGGL